MFDFRTSIKSKWDGEKVLDMAAKSWSVFFGPLLFICMIDISYRSMPMVIPIVIAFLSTVRGILTFAKKEKGYKYKFIPSMAIWLFLISLHIYTESTIHAMEKDGNAIVDAIEAYKEKFGLYPDNLSQLASVGYYNDKQVIDTYRYFARPEGRDYYISFHAHRGRYFLIDKKERQWTDTDLFTRGHD